MEPKKKTSKDEGNTPRKKQNEYSKPAGPPPRTNEKDHKKDQETSWNTPRKKQNEYSKPAGSGSPIDDHKKTSPKKVIAKPVDSKKINDKKTGSSDKKNPHTRSSKERIY
jgi:hypothetical protein